MKTLTQARAETRTSSTVAILSYAAVVLALLLVLAVELVIPARRQSATFDEACHLYAGYNYWTRADFGVNPEHPPLVKLIAALPLLKQTLPGSEPLPIHIKPQCFIGGRQFLYSGQTADSMLFKARMAAATLTIAAALAVFAAAYEMFGAIAALLSLLLFVFEPNLLAHGNLVTTDMGLSLFLFATVFAFYRFVQKPSAWWLVLTGVLAGLTLAAKHSGILSIPILCVLALTEILRHDENAPLCRGGRLRCALRLAGSLIIVGLISFGILWSFYGFRYAARPHGQAIIPTISDYSAEIEHPWERSVILFAARHHLLPESYLLGIVDIIVFPVKYMTSYVFGKLYRHSRWFYFPAAFLIKSTLGLLLLLLLVPVAVGLRRTRQKRELLFLLVPPLVYFVAAAQAGFNIGVRHILPVYPFIIVLAAFSAWQLSQLGSAWRYSVAVLLIFQIISSARAFPNYLPYSNELWGGPANTYKLLNDSNVDWAQQLKSTKKYLDKHGIKDCWFDYFGHGLVADPVYYQIPCRPLQDAVDFAPVGNIPVHISGTVLISAMELSPGLWGPGELNPYVQFQQLRPDILIDDGILVFHGEFDIPLASATAHARAATVVLFAPKVSDAQLQHALSEAQTAVSLAPKDENSQEALGDILMKLNRKDEARAAYQRALNLAETIYPEFHDQSIAGLKQKLR